MSFPLVGLGQNTKKIDNQVPLTKSHHASHPHVTFSAYPPSITCGAHQFDDPDHRTMGGSHKQRGAVSSTHMYSAVQVSIVTSKWLLELGIIWLSIVDDDFIKTNGNKEEYGWRYYWINGRQDRVQSPHLLKCLLCVVLSFASFSFDHHTHTWNWIIPPTLFFSSFCLSFHLCLGYHPMVICCSLMTCVLVLFYHSMLFFSVLGIEVYDPNVLD